MQARAGRNRRIRPITNRGKEFPHACPISLGPGLLRPGAGGAVGLTGLRGSPGRSAGRPVAFGRRCDGHQSAGVAGRARLRPAGCPGRDHHSGDVRPVNRTDGRADRTGPRPPPPCRPIIIMGCWAAAIASSASAPRKAADGVDIPPPPGFAGAQVMAPGETIVSGPVVVSERIVSADDPHAPGYAVVGGQETAAPGYAVVNGRGRTPIRPRSAWPVAPRRCRRIPAWPARCRVRRRALRPGRHAVQHPAGTDRDGRSGARSPPHHQSYLRAAQAGQALRRACRAKRGEHAAIAYGDSGQKVTDLPASVVYKQK